MDDWKTFLQDIYFKIKVPGSFSGPTKLKVILNENGYDVSIDEIKAWVQDQDAYSLFKPTKYRFKRNRIVTTGIDHMWDADLADVSNIKEHNNDNTYLLVVIDVFSRHLWIQPVKSKNQHDMVEAFKTIFENTNRRPSRLRTDNGKEFINRKLQQYLKSIKIKCFTTKNETKANYAERVIRTVKSLLYRYFLHRQTYHYVDVMQDIVGNYNNRPHKSLDYKSPSDINEKNEAIVWKKMYVDTAKKVKKIKFKFKIGDQVRISHLKYQFQRDYHQKWTEEYFMIFERMRKNGKNMYKLKDLLYESISGHFYENELQKIHKSDDATYRVEKVIKRRSKGQELFVKWVGWPIKFNSWVQADQVQKF